MLTQTGLGTDEAAVHLMMSKDAFGHRRVAIVRDLFDRSIERKHLVIICLHSNLILFCKGFNFQNHIEQMCRAT
jgi:hypothetical protein